MGDLKHKTAGEGSRGGKILGHTRSGKPIYAKHADRRAAASTFTHQDHRDASALHWHTHMMHYSAGQAAEKALESHNLAPSLQAHFLQAAAKHQRLADRHEKASNWHDERDDAALKAEEDAVSNPFLARRR